MTLATAARDTLASAGGAALGGVFRVAGSLRPTAKPLHPRGRLRSGRLVREGSGDPVGAAFLDDPGTDEVLVRVSRATGLPPGLPDVHGLALRVPLPGGGHGDLLLASTGWGPLGRFVLTAGLRPGSRPMTTLLPYRTASGRSVLLGARLSDDDHALLAWAPGTGDWRVFARLELGSDCGDPALAFDPVRHPLPGLTPPEWVRRLRAPAYAGARRSRQ